LNKLKNKIIIRKSFINKLEKDSQITYFYDKVKNNPNPEDANTHDLHLCGNTKKNGETEFSNLI